MIRRLFGKQFKSNVINEQETPSRKLCDDIQNIIGALIVIIEMDF